MRHAYSQRHDIWLDTRRDIVQLGIKRLDGYRDATTAPRPGLVPDR